MGICSLADPRIIPTHPPLLDIRSISSGPLARNCGRNDISSPLAGSFPPRAPPKARAGQVAWRGRAISERPFRLRRHRAAVPPGAAVEKIAEEEEEETPSGAGEERRRTGVRKGANESIRQWMLARRPKRRPSPC